MNIIFLYLKGFSGIGGIEKFNRSFLKALSEISDNSPEIKFYALSLYDEKQDSRYIDKNFKGFNSNKVLFFFNFLKHLIKSDTVILGHANLSICGIISKLFNKRVLIIAHGIEVWQSNSFIRKVAIKLSNKILSVSHYTKNRIIEDFNINSNKISIFHNTIDPFFNSNNKDDGEIREKYGISSDDKIVLTVSRLSFNEQYKGYDKVIEILSNIKQSIQKIKYVIVGSGDIKEIERITNLAKKHNVLKELDIVGQLEDDELVKFYNLADLFILPSKGEGFGIVFLEALACGKPVIGGNKDGSNEPLMNGELGTLIDPDDLNQIKNSIIKILSDTEKKDLELKKEKVYKNFGFDKFKENLIFILNSI